MYRSQKAEEPPLATAERSIKEASAKEVGELTIMAYRGGIFDVVPASLAREVFAYAASIQLGTLTSYIQKLPALKGA